MVELIRSILSFPSLTVPKVLFLVGITLAATLFEGFGVAMLFPVMDFIEKGKDFHALAQSSKMWVFIGKAFEALAIPKNLLALEAAVFGLLIVRQVFIYVKATYSIRVTESLLSDIRGLGFESFAKSDLEFFDSHGVGLLVNALTVDGVRAGGGVFTFFNFLSASLVFTFYVVFLLVLSPGLTLFAVTIMGGVGLILKSRIGKSEKIGRTVSEYNERISSAIVERLSGIRLLKVAASEDRESEFIKGLSEKIRDNTYSLGRIRARMEFTVDPMVVLAGLIILYFSVEVFHMSLAKTGIFIFVLLRLMPYTKDIFNSVQAMAGFSGSLFRVLDLFREAQESRRIRGGSQKFPKLEREIRLQDISFCYDKAKGYALKDLNLVFPAGKMTALVGRSGAGKSTLVDLIPRLRIPAEGRIWFDQDPIENFDLDVLRRSIAFVSQEGFLFNDTIENNLKYCNPGAGDDEVRWAAKMAYADVFIRDFPEGYATMVGERGARLSGGQRQRVILARALLQKAKIIVLDEPTSALDSESEKYIQSAIEQIRAQGDITMIVIAHRLSTIKRADQIIVLEKGRTVEWGSHADLMHDDNWYAAMAKIQGAL